MMDFKLSHIFIKKLKKIDKNYTAVINPLLKVIVGVIKRVIIL